MKRLMYLAMIALLSALIFLPVSSAFAKAPKVPITYPGDTEETIARRAQWIEGAKKETKLIWWGTQTPRDKDKIIAEFNKIYPFIKGEHWFARSHESAAKVEAEFSAAHPRVDIVLGADENNFPRWRKIGLTDKFTHIIPGIEKLHKRMYGRNGDWIQPGHTACTPQYNTNLVSAAELPKTWEDMLDPKWKGQLGMPTDVKWWAAMAVADGGWGIEKAEDFLRTLKKQNLLWARGNTATHTLLIAGEFKIAVNGYIRHIQNSRKKGAPVNWVRVNPALVGGSSFILMKRAPHPNAARLFLEWLLSPQGLVIYEDIILYGAVYPGSQTLLAKTLKGLDIVYRDEESILKAAELGLSKRFSEILGIQ